MRTLLLIAVLVLGSVLLKVLGPVLAGGRHPPEALTRVIALLAPALITALVVSDTLTSGRHLMIDARLAGVGVALWLRAPVLVALLLAALTCALLRTAS